MSNTVLNPPDAHDLDCWLICHFHTFQIADVILVPVRLCTTSPYRIDADARIVTSTGPGIQQYLTQGTVLVRVSLLCGVSSYEYE
eukprot:scaffold326776_cov30-Prasinocladus_malaysianus.AAC.1